MKDWVRTIVEGLERSPVLQSDPSLHAVWHHLRNPDVHHEAEFLATVLVEMTERYEKLMQDYITLKISEPPKSFKITLQDPTHP